MKKKGLNFFLFLWELPQNMLGFMFFALSGIFNRIMDTSIEDGRIFIRIASNGASLGHFIFWSSLKPEDFNGSCNIKLHELGHSLQSRFLGPLYLLVVGVPSSFRFLYAQYFHMKNKKRWENYFKGYPENWAEVLGCQNNHK